MWFLYFLAAYHATKKVVHRVPKGTSEYQAAWIVESDQEDEDEDEVGFKLFFQNSTLELVSYLLLCKHLIDV